MQTHDPLTAYRRLPVIVLQRPAPTSPAIRAALARLRLALALGAQAPAPALTIFAAGLGLALVWGGYEVLGLVLPALAGIGLAIRGAAHGGGRRTLALMLAGVVILGLVCMLWR